MYISIHNRIRTVSNLLFNFVIDNASLCCANHQPSYFYLYTFNTFQCHFLISLILWVMSVSEKYVIYRLIKRLKYQKLFIKYILISVTAY